MIRNKYNEILCHSILAITPNFSKFEKAVVCFFVCFLSFKKAGAHLQYICKKSAKFQRECLIAVGGVDYTHFLEGTERYTDGQTDRGKHNDP